MKKSYYVILTLIFTTLTTVAQSYTGERIISLHSDITIHKNASLTVTETIKVVAQHHLIKRGITRSFPTTYTNRYRKKTVVSFDVEKVLMDGQPHPYNIRRAYNGKIVDFGNDSFIKPGIHTYQITYRTNRQLTFKDNYTELYFNVVGNDVVFPTLKASAVIHLPKEINVKDIELEGYTGYYGATNKNYKSWISDHNTCHFETTKILQPKESFTISVAFPNSSAILPPSKYQELIWLIQDNLDLFITLLCIILLLILYSMAWLKKRRNSPTIMPLFNPPNDMLPSDCAYLYYKSTNNANLTAAILDMAVQGYLTIKHNPGGWLKSETYTLTKKEVHENTTPTYDQISNEFFAKNNELTLKKKNKFIILEAIQTLANKSETYSKYITNNYSTLLTCFAITTASIATVAFLQQSDVIVALVPISVLINIAGFFILRDYTKSGKKLYAEIAGFKMYLSFTEKDRIERLNPPTMTTNLFEKYLPYAVALGVDKQWSRAFDKMFAQLAAQGHAYHPYWYVGRRFNANNFSSNINSFNRSLSNAISSSSGTPGSSSGRGGGGFSGGGGGGGGIGGR